MPSWVWICLVVWFILCLIIGVAYVIVHALRAVRLLSQTSMQVSKPLEQLQEHVPTQEPEATVLEESFEQTRQRYVQTQIVRRHHAQERKMAHAKVWKRWKNS